MKVISIINQKGGAGKTTTAHAIGCGLRRNGSKILFIDLDGQGNLTYTTGASQAGTTAADLLFTGSQTDVTEAIQHTGQGDVIASSPALAGADKLLESWHCLREKLEPIKKSYDYIIIDCPPALGILTLNALTASDSCIAPAQADGYSQIALTQLFQTITAVRNCSNPGLTFNGIVLTRYNARSVISRQITELIDTTAQQMGTRLYKAKIRECTAVKEAQLLQQDLFTYAPRSNAAKDYTALVKEIIEREG